MRLIVRKLLMKAGWWDAPLTLQDLAKAICKLYIFFIYLKHFYNFIIHIYIVFAAWKMKGGKKKKRRKKFFRKISPGFIFTNLPFPKFSRGFIFLNWQLSNISQGFNFANLRKIRKIREHLSTQKLVPLRYIKVIWIMW